MTDHTVNFKKRTGASSGEAPVVLIEIDHPALAQPHRVCNDNSDIVSNGNTFTACAFNIAFPDDTAGSMPRAPFSIDGIDGVLRQWMDASLGGRGATMRMMQVMRGTPNIIEQEFTLDLINTKMNMEAISGELGYENVLDLQALPATYTPEITPTLF